MFWSVTTIVKKLVAHSSNSKHSYPLFPNKFHYLTAFMVTVWHLHDLLERHCARAQLTVLLKEQERLFIILGHLDNHPHLVLGPLLIKKLDYQFSLSKIGNLSFSQISSDLSL